MARDSATLEWVSAIATIAAVVLALLLGLGLKDWLIRPSLKLTSADDDPSSRMAFPFSDGRVGGWARIQVSNEGRAPARGIHVRIGSIERWDGEAWVRERAELDARALAWAHVPAGVPVDIPPGSTQPLDLISIHQGDDAGTAFMRLEISDYINSAPSSGGHLFLEAGSWRLELVHDGDNVEATRHYVTIGFSAEWWDPGSGKLWTHSAVISGPRSSPPAAPSVAPTSAEMLAAAAQEDAAGDVDVDEA
jgi:hypothetical protein